MPKFGGSSDWIKGPSELDSRQLVKVAKEKGVLIEPGDVFFSNSDKNKNYFRLGFSSISDDKIEPGINLLAQCVEEVL